MDVVKSDNEPLVGERYKFVDAWTLVELGYVQEFLYYADTEWRVVKITPSWIQNSIKYYFDLENEKGITISCIADEVLIKMS